MSDDRVLGSLLLSLLDGAVFANALRRNGKPCRIRLPDDHGARTALIDAHLQGAPSTLNFHAEGHEPWRERVDAVALAAFCPGEDGLCRWVAIDIDAIDHGERGLVDPVHAMRTLAERADAVGLAPGLLAARSRRGRGRHVFLLLPEPVALADAVIGVAALASAALRVAASDVAEYGAEHAFRRANGAIASLGDVGAVEFFPRSTLKPPFGWALALPAAGTCRAVGGGVIVDPFEDRPIHHEVVPRCEPEPWCQFTAEAGAALSKRRAATAFPRTRPLNKYYDRRRKPIDHIDVRTRAFIDGHTPEGTRNEAAFAAGANLLGCGVDRREAERLILTGAAMCGLPQREAMNAFKSAVQALSRRGIPK